MLIIEDDAPFAQPFTFHMFQANDNDGDDDRSGDNNTMNGRNSVTF